MFGKSLSECINKFEVNEKEQFTAKELLKIVGKQFKVTNKNGVLFATKEAGKRLITVRLEDESGSNDYYAIEYKDSNLEGNDVNYDTLAKAKGVKPKYIKTTIDKMLKKANESFSEGADKLTTLKDASSAEKSLMLAEGSLYMAVDRSSDLGDDKYTSGIKDIYKSVRKSYDDLIKLNKKYNK